MRLRSAISSMDTHVGFWVLVLLEVSMMKPIRISFALTACALSVFGCDCADPLDRLAPIIAIGDPFDAEFSVCASGLGERDKNPFRDCAFDFGEVDVGRARVFSFTVRNPSPVRLVVESVTLDDGSDPAFEFDSQLPEIIEPGIGSAGSVVSVKFAPTVEGPVSAVVRIKSDGENLGEGEDVLINLTATGTSRCQPDINVLPATCDFGDVGVGATGFCDLSIENVGECELVISDLGFTPETPQTVFGAQSAVNIPLTIPGGTATSIRLYARPSTATTFAGGMVITSFDPDEPEVVVPLTVRGAQAPTCVARVSRINNAPNNNPSPAIEPLDAIELSADQSTASRQGGTIQSWQWQLIDQPPESSATLEFSDRRETNFVFSSAAGRVRGIDVAGTFTVGLIVTDDLGAQSTQCTIALNAVPRSGLHVQMTWDASVGDVDLHLSRGTNWCGNDDAYYQNPTTSWGATLDIDDTCGFGPENITIDTVPDGRYTIGVTYFGAGFTASGPSCGSQTPSTNVVVKVFIGGQLEFEGVANLARGAPWIPARVEVVNGISQLTELNDLSRGANCLSR